MRSKLARVLMTLAASSAVVASTPAQESVTPVGRNLFTRTAPPQAAPLAPVPPVPPTAATTFNPPGFFWAQPKGATTFTTRYDTAPEDAKFAQEADQLAQQLGEAKSDTEQDRIKTQLGELLKQQFDQRQKRHEREIAELEGQVKKLKDLVSKRQENGREIIAQRLEQIVRESQGLGW